MPDSEKPRTWGVWTGRELKTIQLWRSPEGVVVLRNPEGLRQIEFTAAQWEKISEHVAGEPDVDLSTMEPPDAESREWLDAPMGPYREEPDDAR